MTDIIQINDNTWRIEDDGVRFFILEGKNEALMIDSGMTNDIPQMVRTGLHYRTEPHS